MIDDDTVTNAVDWIERGLVRAFGLAVTLREDAWNLPYEEVIRRSVESQQRSLKWTVEGIEEINQTLQNLHAIKDQTSILASEWDKANKDITARIGRMNVENAEIKRKHDKIRGELEIILSSPDIAEITRNIVQFGIDQLDLVDRHLEPYEATLYVSPNDYYTKQLANALHSLNWRTRDLKQKYTQGPKLAESFLRLRKDIRNVLPDDIVN
jgi:hypothetical protein